METKTLKIDIPEGYEIDKEKSTFENIIFKKVEQSFSKNWGEFCRRHPLDPDNERRISSIFGSIEKPVCCPRESYYRAHIPKKFAEPMRAFMQLLTIREKEYTKGWEPDWLSTSPKYCIRAYANSYHKTIIESSNQCTLSFPTKELLDEFYKNWKDLIEIAKPLL